MNDKAKNAANIIRACIREELRRLPAEDQIAVVEALGLYASELIGKAAKFCGTGMSGSLVAR